MAKKTNDIFIKFLELLNTTWGKLSIIVIIAGAGFHFGCLYQEARMNREYAKFEAEKRCEWQKKEFEYQQQLIEQQANIKEKEIIIKIYETRQR